MPATEPGPFELLRARCLIEAEICSLAAETRKDADLDRIFSALADMRTALVRVVQEIRDSSHSISDATGEIAAGNHDLSART